MGRFLSSRKRGELGLCPIEPDMYAFIAVTGQQMVLFLKKGKVTPLLSLSILVPLSSSDASSPLITKALLCTFRFALGEGSNSPILAKVNIPTHSIAQKALSLWDLGLSSGLIRVRMSSVKGNLLLKTSL